METRVGDLNTMLDRLQEKIKGVHGAFSVAEMLVVLLIISFLILALPPIVHKKVAKRITRGEHGRYECWRDPNDGLLYEYYATEKNGPDPKYLDAAGEVHGEQVEACHFSPKDMAPNAAYFSFQAVGGGAGGSYPISDGSSTYQDDDYSETAIVNLGTSCCSTYYAEHYNNSNSTSCYNTETNYYGDYKYRVPGEPEGIEHDGARGESPDYPCPDNQGGRKSTLGQQCYHYKGSLYYWRKNERTKAWIDKYWVPVPGSGTIKICSGKGYTGMSDKFLTQYYDEYNNQIMEFIYYYGGQGGNGACWTRDASTVFLGADNRYKVVYGQRKDSPRYYYGCNQGTNNSIITEKTSWEFSTNENSAYTDWTNPDPEIELDSYNSQWQVPRPAGGNAIPYPYSTLCDNPDPYYCGGQYYAGNYVKAMLDGGGDADECFVAPGFNGARADTNSTMINNEYQNSPLTRGAQSNSTCNAPWTYYSPNVSFEATISNPTFPSTITITRRYGYDTPTMGYAGSPGVSIGMFLPKLQDDLSFEIGEAGAPGTAGNKRGGNGGNTVVKSGSTVILTANGGRGQIGGEAGNKVLMFGRDTLFGRVAVEPVFDASDLSDIKITLGRPAINGVCEGTELEFPNGRIDGCLDKMVARDNPKRFADESEFYTILELDPESRTPSVINKLYGEDESRNMPGTAGDGGYNFLRSVGGSETVTYQNHPLNDLIRAQNPDYEYDLNFNEDYTCYRNGDQLGHPTGAVVHAPDTVCQPTKGFPGAVVIVW